MSDQADVILVMFLPPIFGLFYLIYLLVKAATTIDEVQFAEGEATEAIEDSRTTGYVRVEAPSGQEVFVKNAIYLYHNKEDTYFVEPWAYSRKGDVIEWLEVWVTLYDSDILLFRFPDLKKERIELKKEMKHFYEKIPVHIKAKVKSVSNSQAEVFTLKLAVRDKYGNKLMGNLTLKIGVFAKP